MYAFSRKHRRIDRGGDCGKNTPGAGRREDGVGSAGCRDTEGSAGLAAELKTRVLLEHEYPAWAALVASSPDGSIYSIPDYLGALCRASGAEFRVLVAERDGRIVGGIGLYERKSRFGRYVHPRRLLYYNGIVRMPHETKYPSQRMSWSLQTLAALERAMTEQGYVRLRIKSRSTLADVRVFAEHGWSVTPTYSYVVDISDLAATRERIEKNLRRLIGRCEEQGVTLSVNDDFDEFFRLHEETNRRKGAGLYLPHAAFRGYFEELRSKDLCRLYHARMPDGRVAASQFVLTGPHPITHTVSAATDEAFLNLGVSAFLRWKAFEHLSNDGYLGNDLTDASLNPVTHFKSQLGGELELNLELWRRDHTMVRFATATTAGKNSGKRLLGRALRAVRGKRA
jgi:hypothetical protein